jgi:hypothetical protein
MTAYDDTRGWKLPPNPSTSQTICVKFRIPDTEEYRRATAGAVIELTKWHNWERDEEQRAKVASQLFRKTILELFTFGDCEDGNGSGENMPIDFMQDGCKLFYSKDNGESWILAFDYEICFEGLIGSGTPADQVIMNGATLQEIQRLLDGWNMGERPDDGVLDPYFWDVATCLATYSIIEGIMQALLAKRRQEGNFDIVAIVGGTLLGGVSIADLFLKAISWKIYAAIGVLTLGWAGLQYINRSDIVDIPEEEFSDLALLDELRSRLYNSMKGIAPSLISWQQSLDGVSPVTPNALKIRDYIKEGLTLEAFLGYLQITRILYDFAVAENYTENACEQIVTCDATTWDFTFMTEAPAFMRFENKVPTVDGLLKVQPFVPEQWQVIDPAEPFIVNTSRSLHCVVVKECTRPIEVVWSRANTNSAGCFIDVWEGGEWIQKASSSIAVSLTTATVRTFSWTPPIGDVYTQFRVRIQTTAPQLRRVRLL